METKKRYAIIGKGFIFSRHKEAIELTGGEVVLTCDIDPEKKADYTDYRNMFNCPEMKKVDVVVIVSLVQKVLSKTTIYN